MLLAEMAFRSSDQDHLFYFNKLRLIEEKINRKFTRGNKVISL